MGMVGVFGLIISITMGNPPGSIAGILVAQGIFWIFVFCSERGGSYSSLAGPITENKSHIYRTWTRFLTEKMEEPHMQEKSPKEQEQYLSDSLFDHCVSVNKAITRAQAWTYVSQFLKTYQETPPIQEESRTF